MMFEKKKIKQQLAPNPGANTKNKRRRVLAQTNAYLNALDLPPFQRLGDAKQGEIEINKKPLWYVPHGEKIYAVFFEWLYPDGHTEVWPLIFNRDQEKVRVGQRTYMVGGAITAVVLNNERFVLCSQHRPTLDGYMPWPWEFPRGFNPAGMLSLPAAKFPFSIPPGDDERQHMRIPSAITRRKLAPLLTDARVYVASVQLLGLSPENTGKDRNMVAVYRMDISVDPSELDALMKERTGTSQIRIGYPRFEEAFAAANRWPDFYQNATPIFMMLRAQRTPEELAAFLRGDS